MTFDLSILGDEFVLLGNRITMQVLPSSTMVSLRHSLNRMVDNLPHAVIAREQEVMKAPMGVKAWLEENCRDVWWTGIELGSQTIRFRDSNDAVYFMLRYSDYYTPQV